MKLKRASVWEVAGWLLMLVAVANAIRVLRDPEFLRFSGFWLSVLAAVAAVGSVIALIIVAARRIAGSSQTTPPRIT